MRMKEKYDPVAPRFRWSSRRLLAVTLIAVTAAYFAAQRGEQTMLANTVASSFRAPRPLIDTAVPRQIATATFAMG